MIEKGLVSGDNYEITYAFINPAQFSGELPSSINSVEIGTLRFFYLLETAQFVIANTRISGGMCWPFKKKEGQYFIQTMHGGHGMKKQELEVCDKLSESYLQRLYEDASRIDLMISDSTFWTNKARTIFAYPKGEIIEEGLPRNDIFFASEEKKREIKKSLCSRIGVDYSADIKFAVYCPTFRANGRRDVYGFDTDKVLTAFEKRFGGTWYVLVSSHPNMQSFYKEIYDFSNPRMIDVGKEDLQPILVASDAAVTDYSSAGFEFALSQNPCFLLCRDLDDYDRGVYFDMRTLPFPYSENDEQLVQNILSFDAEKYRTKLDIFNRDVIGLKETGHAAETVVSWILSHS